MTRDEELWAMALWVEKHYGEEGWLYISQQQDRLLAGTETDGVKMWQEVAKRFEKLQARPKQTS